MITRNMQTAVKEAAKGFPVITITGPRQSGKTTLAKLCFPKYNYFNLENPEMKNRADSDPRSLFADLKKGIVIDEIQKCPELLSWVQVFVDESNLVGKVILTGSNQFEYIGNIGQSLAGRTAVFKLLPFSISEIGVTQRKTWEDVAVKGFYPRLYDRKIAAQLFYSSYVMTYLERDIRSLMQVRNLKQFETFVNLCAGRTGQILNINTLSIECGVDFKTVQAWLSLLQASFIIYLMRPYHSNLNKRLIKSPKLYFFDSGLVCYLLGIRNRSDLLTHPMRGAIFETMVVGDILKYYMNQGIVPPLTFYRDVQGHELDLIIEQGNSVYPVEIKAGTTITQDYWKNITYFRKSHKSEMRAGIVFADKRSEHINKVDIAGWDRIEELLS